MDVRVLGFALLVSLLAGVLAGIIPAVTNSMLKHHENLKEGSIAPGSPAAVRAGDCSAVFVVAETALALVLLAGSGLMLENFQRLQHRDLGIDTNRL